jgi:tetratricopeptide (TPR) repeat protein
MATTSVCNALATSSLEDVLLADALLGAGLPEAAERHLHRASLAYQHDEVAERHLREAQALAPGHAVVLIGLYRFYFYKGRLDQALDVARICLDKAAQDNNLKGDWHCVAPGDADFGSYDAVLPRFYMFTLKAYAYLQMRLGDVVEGRAAVLKLLELDPTDKLGARVLLGVVERRGGGDDE